MNVIKEAIKFHNGKPSYTIMMSNTENDSKAFVSIRNGEIYFESNDYGFNSSPVFDMGSDAHRLAKEMFTSSLLVDVQNKILALKQLEAILNEMGLVDIIREPMSKMDAIQYYEAIRRIEGGLQND